LRLLRKSVNAALELLAAPAARPRIVWIIRQSSTGFAADAGVTLIVLGQIAQLIRTGVFPDLCPRPVSQGTHLQEHLSRGQPVLFDLAQILSRWGLLATKPSEPNLEWLQRLHQGFYFSQLAALRGIFAIQNAEFGLLLRDSLLWYDVDEIQIPFESDLV